MSGRWTARSGLKQERLVTMLSGPAGNLYFPRSVLWAPWRSWTVHTYILPTVYFYR